MSRVLFIRVRLFVFLFSDLTRGSAQITLSEDLLVQSNIVFDIRELGYGLPAVGDIADP